MGWSSDGILRYLILVALNRPSFSGMISSERKSMIAEIFFEQLYAHLQLENILGRHVLSIRVSA